MHESVSDLAPLCHGMLRSIGSCPCPVCPSPCPCWCETLPLQSAAAPMLRLSSPSTSPPLCWLPVSSPSTFSCSIDTKRNNNVTAKRLLTLAGLVPTSYWWWSVYLPPPAVRSCPWSSSLQEVLSPAGVHERNVGHHKSKLIKVCHKHACIDLVVSSAVWFSVGFLFSLPACELLMPSTVILLEQQVLKHNTKEYSVHTQCISRIKFFPPLSTTESKLKPISWSLPHL